MVTKFQTEKETMKPGVAKALITLGYVVIVCGIICGFAYGRQEVGYYYSRTEFSLFLAMIYWAAGAISGTVLIGLGKILELLTVIANKDYLYVQVPADSMATTTNTSSN